MKLKFKKTLDKKNIPAWSSKSRDRDLNDTRKYFFSQRQRAILNETENDTLLGLDKDTERSTFKFQSILIKGLQKKLRPFTWHTSCKKTCSNACPCSLRRYNVSRHPPERWALPSAVAARRSDISQRRKSRARFWRVRFLPRCAGMQTRSSDENSVCPSVKRVNCDKTEEKSVQIFIVFN